MEVIDFNSLVEINKLLDENNVGCTLHSIGGCASCGVEFSIKRIDANIKEAVKIVNYYLENKKLFIIPTSDGSRYQVKSVWEKIK